MIDTCGLGVWNAGCLESNRSGDLVMAGKESPCRIDDGHIFAHLLELLQLDQPPLDPIKRTTDIETPEHEVPLGRERLQLLSTNQRGSSKPASCGGKQRVVRVGRLTCNDEESPQRVGVPAEREQASAHVLFSWGTCS